MDQVTDVTGKSSESITTDCENMGEGITPQKASLVGGIDEDMETDSLELTEDEIKDEEKAIISELRELGVKIPGVKRKTKMKKTQALIFGQALEDQEWCVKPQIPRFMYECINHLSKWDSVEGIFRKSGSKVRINAFKEKVQAGIGPYDFDDLNPHDVASLLKDWLKELPEPFISSYVSNIIMSCQQLKTIEESTAASLLACLLLPIENLFITQYLLSFLFSISQKSETNKMNVNNLAIVLAPNVFPNDRQPLDKKISVLELFISNYYCVGEIPSRFFNTVEVKSKGRKERTFQTLLHGIRKFFSRNLTRDSFLSPKCVRFRGKRKSNNLSETNELSEQLVSKKERISAVMRKPSITKSSGRNAFSKWRKWKAQFKQNKPKKGLIESLNVILAKTDTFKCPVCVQGLGKCSCTPFVSLNKSTDELSEHQGDQTYGTSSTWNLLSPIVEKVDLVSNSLEALKLQLSQLDINPNSELQSDQRIFKTPENYLQSPFLTSTPMNKVCVTPLEKKSFRRKKYRNAFYKEVIEPIEENPSMHLSTSSNGTPYGKLDSHETGDGSHLASTNVKSSNFSSCLDEISDENQLPHTVVKSSGLSSLTEQEPIHDINQEYFKFDAKPTPLHRNLPNERTPLQSIDNVPVFSRQSIQKASERYLITSLLNNISDPIKDLRAEFETLDNLDIYRMKSFPPSEFDVRKCYNISIPKPHYKQDFELDFFGKIINHQEDDWPDEEFLIPDKSPPSLRSLLFKTRTVPSIFKSEPLPPPNILSRAPKYKLNSNSATTDSLSKCKDGL